MQNRVVVITGGAQGIGRALAKEYLKTGHKVVILDINSEAIEECKGQLLSADLFFYRVDVTNLPELEKVGKQIQETLGSPHVWINNAGLARAGKFEKIPADDFLKVINVNLNGVINGTRVALSLMYDDKARTIVNVASVTAELPVPYLSSYVASKHAVAGFTRSLQLEKAHAEEGPQLVLVSPGFAKTQIMNQGPEFEFPKGFEWLVDEPSKVAQEIIEGIEKGKTEIVPTLNGKLFNSLNRLSPLLMRKSTRLLVAKNWRELLGFDSIKK